MKTFKKFILEQLHQQILLEMPHLSLGNGDKFIDLEFELRVPGLANFSGNPDKVYNALVLYLNQWYQGYSFLYKVKEPWTEFSGFGGLKSKLTPGDEFTSFDGKIRYKFNGTKVYKLIPSGDPENPIEKEEIPKKIEPNELTDFLKQLRVRLAPTLAALGKTSVDDIDQFIEDIKNPSNILLQI